MIVIATSSTSATRAAAHRRTVDVFGVRWPLHKAEAVVAALVIFALGALLIAATGGASLTPAVLAGAGAGVVVWWAGRLLHSAS